MNSDRLRIIFLFQLVVVLVVVWALPGASHPTGPLKETTEAMEPVEDVDSVEAVETEAAEPRDVLFKAEIRDLVNEISDGNAGLLRGVDKILVSEEPINFLARSDPQVCLTGDIAGAHSHGTIIIKDNGFEINRNTLYHEIGHNVWDTMDMEQRQEWTSLFGSTTDFISTYSKTNPTEDFAENFACFFSNYDNCTQRMILDKVEFVQGIVDEVG